MALYKSEAIVLRSDPFGEADRLLDLLTPFDGRMRAVARGVRRPTSRLAGAVLPFTHCRLLLWQGRSLDGVNQAEVIRSFRSLREDLGRLAAAIYACELAVELIPEGPGGERDASAPFRLLLVTLELLDADCRVDLALRYCELHFLSLAGFRPNFQRCVLCGTSLATAAYFDAAAGGCLCEGCRDGSARRLSPEALAAARGLFRTAPAGLGNLTVPAPVVAELGEALASLARHVLEKELKSQAFLDIISAERGASS